MITKRNIGNKLLLREQINCSKKENKKVQKILKRIGTAAYNDGDSALGKYALDEAVRLNEIHGLWD